MKTHKTHITLKDYSVSGEVFELLADPSLGLLYTHPKPSDLDLKAYYPDTDYISHTNQLKSLIDVLYHVVRYFSLAFTKILPKSLVNSGAFNLVHGNFKAGPN